MKIHFHYTRLCRLHMHIIPIIMSFDMTAIRLLYDE